MLWRGRRGDFQDLAVRVRAVEPVEAPGREGRPESSQIVEFQKKFRQFLFGQEIVNIIIE